jgi:hypothetical protein
MTGPALPPPEPDRMATPALPPGGGRRIVVGAGFHSDGSRPHLSQRPPQTPVVARGILATDRNHPVITGMLRVIGAVAGL